MWSYLYKIWFLVAFTSGYSVIKSDAITNAKFNSVIRDYSNDANNTANVKTLQKEESGRYANFAPVGNNNVIKSKEIPDSALSSSSYGRGLLYHDHPGYTINDYEDSPHFAYGNDFHGSEPHLEGHGPHNYEHGHHEYDPHHFPVYHHDHGHHNYDHGHYKFHKHALGAKSVLLPIAGLAILGAAAALVSNPILLQLGVVSGKRRRRDTEEITGPDFESESYNNLSKAIQKHKNNNNDEPNSDKTKHSENGGAKVNPHKKTLKRRLLNTHDFTINRNIELRKTRSSLVKTNKDGAPKTPVQFNNTPYEEKYVPIPIMLRSPDNYENV